MSDRLPQRVEPFRWAEQGRQLRGPLSIAEMQRLAPLLRSRKGDINVQLQFGIDEQRIPYLQGRVTGDLEVTCQRCLGSVAFPVDVELSLGLVKSESEGDRLSDRYEPLVVEPGSMSIAAIVEDELILALPIIARHSELEACGAQVPFERGLWQDEDKVPAERVNPFSVLDKLLNKE